MFLDTETFETSIVAKHATQGKTEISIEAKKCLAVTSELSKNGDINGLKVDFNLDSPSLPSRAVHLYEVTLRPDIDEFQIPEWCSEWDMGGARIGYQTLNLLHFVRNLSQVTARTHKPKIAQFYCYIEKR